MINLSTTIFPFHYVSGRSIQLISIIEDWALDYDLSCVIQYIARANHKISTLEDLKKAEWYLDKTSQRKGPNHKDDVVQIDLVRHSPQAVCDDWKLSPPLCSILINIFLSRGCRSHL